MKMQLCATEWSYRFVIRQRRCFTIPICSFGFFFYFIFSIFQITICIIWNCSYYGNCTATHCGCVIYTLTKGFFLFRYLARQFRPHSTCLCVCVQCTKVSQNKLRTKKNSIGLEIRFQFMKMRACSHIPKATVTARDEIIKITIFL